MPGQTNSQSWNRYSYAHNSPVIYVDPSGHEDFPYWCQFSADSASFIQSWYNFQNIQGGIESIDKNTSFIKPSGGTYTPKKTINSSPVEVFDVPSSTADIDPMDYLDPNHVQNPSGSVYDRIPIMDGDLGDATFFEMVDYVSDGFQLAGKNPNPIIGPLASGKAAYHYARYQGYPNHIAYGRGILEGFESIAVSGLAVGGGALGCEVVGTPTLGYG